jgi:hypothetical protein
LSRLTISFLRRDFIIKITSIKILFKSSIANYCVVSKKIMLIMDFQDCLNLYSYLSLFQILNEVTLKKISFINNPLTYSIDLKKVSAPPSLSLSLSHTPSLFLNEIIKIQVLKKVCSVMESYFLFLNFFSLLFDLPPNSRSTPADPSCHTSAARHTG